MNRFKHFIQTWEHTDGREIIVEGDELKDYEPGKLSLCGGDRLMSNLRMIKAGFKLVKET